MQPQSQQQPQTPQPSLNQQRAEQAKAAMGVATMMQKHLLRPKASTSPQNAPGQSQMPQPNNQPAQDPTQGAPSNQQNPTDVKAQMSGLESRLMDELQTLRAEMQSQGDAKKELADLKTSLDAILTSND